MQKVIGAVVVNGNGHLLLCRRHGEQHWTLPGDLLGPSETAVTCLRRVLAEECSLEVKQGGVAHQRNFTGSGLPGWGQVELVAYLVNDYSGNLQMTLQHKEARWVAPEMLQNYRLTEVERQCVHYLLMANLLGHCKQKVVA